MNTQVFSGEDSVAIKLPAHIHDRVTLQNSCSFEELPFGPPHKTAPLQTANPAAAGFAVSEHQNSQPMCKPPLTEKSAPVEYPLSSLAIQAMMDAISLGSPRRLTGMVPTILSSTSWRMALTMSVPM